VPANTASFAFPCAASSRSPPHCWQWAEQRAAGMMTSAYATAGAFLRSSPDVALPDLQLVFVIAVVDDHARKLPLGTAFPAMSMCCVPAVAARWV